MVARERFYERTEDSVLAGLYNNLKDAEFDAGVLTQEGAEFSHEAEAVYSVLKRRGLEKHCAAYHMSRNLEEAFIRDIDDLIDIIEAQTTGGNGVFKDHYTFEGDPISSVASAIECFLWMLKAERERRANG